MTTVCIFSAHGPRVQWAPGVPCALRLFGREMMGIPRGETARGNAEVCSEQCGGVFGATSLPHSPLSCPASCGASSTPRLLGSSTGVSGILDRPIKSGDDGWSRGWGNWPWAGNPRRPGLEPGPITPNVYVALRWSSIPITAHSGGNGLPARASLGRDDEFWFGSPPTLPCHAPLHAGHPVRRGFSAQALASLEYWIARSSRAMTGDMRRYCAPFSSSARKSARARCASLRAASLASPRPK